MTTDHLAHYRLGAELAKYVRSQTGQGVPPVTALQAVVADIAATTPNLAIPLRDVVSRQSFQSLIPLAGSGGGDLQLKALVDDIRQLYHPDVVQAFAEVLNGFLGRRAEVKSRVEESANITTPITSKEAVTTNKGEHSIKDIGLYDTRRSRRDVTKARAELERDFVDRQQYLEREIERISRKSQQRKERAGLGSRDIGGQASKRPRGIVGLYVLSVLALALARIWYSQFGSKMPSPQASPSLPAVTNCRTAESTATMNQLASKAQELLPEVTRWLERETSLNHWSNYRWGYIYTYIDAYRTKKGVFLPDVVQSFQRIAGDAKRLEWMRICES